MKRRGKRKRREKECRDKNEDDARKKKMIAFDNYKEMQIVNDKQKIGITVDCGYVNF